MTKYRVTLEGVAPDLRPTELLFDAESLNRWLRDRAVGSPYYEVRKIFGLKAVAFHIQSVPEGDTNGSRA